MKQNELLIGQSSVHAMEQAGLKLLRTLIEHQFEAYFVGGYVRDKILGRSIADMDIATSALPEQVMELFERSIPTGLKHGTVTILIDSIPFEVTTFRHESAYENYRRPTSVEYITELREDLSRRDFTMNAMALDINGTLIDPFHGMKDLQAGVLRCVGDAKARFREDALRMLRCIRLSAQYDLQVEVDTWQALLSSRELIKAIAMERVRAELERILQGNDPSRGFRLLTESHLLHYTKVDLSSLWSLANRSTGEDDPFQLLNSFIDSDRDEIRWTVLLHLTGVNSEQSRVLLNRLTCAKKIVTGVSHRLNILELIHEWIGMNDRIQSEALGETQVGWFTEYSYKWKTSAVKVGRQVMEDSLRVYQLLNPERSFHETDDLRRWIEEIPIWSIRQLAVTGHDIKKWLEDQGFPTKGPVIGEILNNLWLAVVCGIETNEPSTLLTWVKLEGQSFEG